MSEHPNGTAKLLKEQLNNLRDRESDLANKISKVFNHLRACCKHDETDIELRVVSGFEREVHEVLICKVCEKKLYSEIKKIEN